MIAFSFFFRKQEKDIPLEETPWYGLPPIYEHIEKHIDLTGMILGEGQKLPDEERRFSDGGVRWAAGAMGGVFSHHGGAVDGKKIAKKIASLTKDIAKSGALAKKLALYNILKDDELIDFIDAAAEMIINANIPIDPHLRQFAKWLVLKSPDRGPLKFGIVLLGLIGDTRDLPIVKAIGKHEEFTLYATVAIENTMDNPTLALWELAKCVKGWGKIDIVERIAKTANPDIKEWLLLDGYKNNVMYEYLAYTCAVNGDLKSALSQNKIDDRLLQSAGEIIEALLNGGPAENIDDYTEAAPVLSLYLDHLLKNTNAIDQFVLVHRIKAYLAEPEEKWKGKENLGWSKENRSNLISKADLILSDSKWKDLVISKLSTESDFEFHYVNRAAGILGIDIWETHWKRLQASPFDTGNWFGIMQKANIFNIRQITDFAIQTLPLSEIATGPSDEMGFGKEYKYHNCLDFILQGLGKFPSFGFPLIEASLKSPVIRNRNMAIRALSEWGKVNWPPNTEDLLKAAISDEPEQSVKERLEKLMGG